MRLRTELDDILVGIMGFDLDDTHVYFQPPENYKIKYPCIIYELGNERAHQADNMRYAQFKRYDLTLIDKDPDTKYYDLIEALPFCAFDRHFTSGNLHHYVFDIYF